MISGTLNNGQPLATCQFPGCSKPVFSGSTYCSKSHRECVEASRDVAVLPAHPYLFLVHPSKLLDLVRQRIPAHHKPLSAPEFGREFCFYLVKVLEYVAF